MSDCLKILVVDDHPLMLESLVQMVVQALPNCTDISRAASYAQARRHATDAFSPRMVLLDPGLPDLSGAQAIQGMVSALPDGAVVVISANDSLQDQEAAWAAGAHSFISKAADATVLVKGLQAIAQGQRVLICRQNVMAVPPETAPTSSALSPRQLAVLCALCAGQSNKVIARHLDISEKTVKVHMGVIFQKLGVASRTQAALVARHLGLVSEAPEASATDFTPVAPVQA